MSTTFENIIWTVFCGGDKRSDCSANLFFFLKLEASLSSTKRELSVCVDGEKSIAKSESY